MVSDKDIESYTVSHYRPSQMTPQQYMQQTHWGSGVRQKIAYDEANRLYEQYQGNFVELPFIDLTPQQQSLNVLQRIQEGQPVTQSPPEDLLNILPEPQITEPAPVFEEEPNISPIRRIFNAIRGIFS